MSRTALLLLALGAAAATACRDATPVAKPDAGVTAGAHPVLADAGARSEGAIRGDAVPAGSLHAVPASSWVFAVFHADPAARAPRVKTGVFKPGRGAREKLRR